MIFVEFTLCYAKKKRKTITTAPQVNIGTIWIKALRTTFLGLQRMYRALTINMPNETNAKKAQGIIKYQVQLNSTGPNKSVHKATAMMTRRDMIGCNR